MEVGLWGVSNFGGLGGEGTNGRVFVGEGVVDGHVFEKVLDVGGKEAFDF